MSRIDDALEEFFDNAGVERPEMTALGQGRLLYEHGIDLVYGKKPPQVKTHAGLMESLLNLVTADLDQPARLSHWRLSVLWVFRFELLTIQFVEEFCDCWRGPVNPLDVIRWSKWVRDGPLFEGLEVAMEHNPEVAKALLDHIRTLPPDQVTLDSPLFKLAQSIPLRRRLAFIRERMGGLRGLYVMGNDYQQAVYDRFGLDGDFSVPYDGSMSFDSILQAIEEHVRLTGDGELIVMNAVEMGIMGAYLAASILFSRPLGLAIPRPQLEMLVVRMVRRVVEMEEVERLFPWIEFKSDVPPFEPLIGKVRRDRLFTCAESFTQYLPYWMLLTEEETMALLATT